MALILKQKETSFRRWYRANKGTLSQQRKQRYAQDPEYRRRAVEASRRYRLGQSTPIVPPIDAPIPFAQAAKRIGVSVSTLHAWRKKQYLPEPKSENGRIWFTEHQVLLLMKLKEVIRMYGNRRGKVKQHQLNEVGQFIDANWN